MKSETLWATSSLELPVTLNRMMLISVVVHGLLIFSIMPENSRPKIPLQQTACPPIHIHKGPIFKPPVAPTQKPSVKSTRNTRALKPIPAPLPDEPELDLADWQLNLESETEDFRFEDSVFTDTLPAPPSQEGPVKLRSDIVQPRLIKRVDPAYPELARKARVQGNTAIELVVGTDGLVTDARALSSTGLKLLDEAAVSAVKQWVFTPATLNGRPISVYYNVTIVFKLT